MIQSHVKNDTGHILVDAAGYQLLQTTANPRRLGLDEPTLAAVLLGVPVYVDQCICTEPEEDHDGA